MTFKELLGAWVEWGEQGLLLAVTTAACATSGLHEYAGTYNPVYSTFVDIMLQPGGTPN